MQCFLWLKSTVVQLVLAFITLCFAPNRAPALQLSGVFPIAAILSVDGTNS